MVKIEMHKYGSNGSVSLEDECKVYELQDRVKQLAAVLKFTIADLGINPPVKVEVEEEE